MRFLQVIPARKGSSFIGKNLFPVLGYPLVSYTINSAKNLLYDHEIIVSTNDEYVKQEAIKHNVNFHSRSEKLCDGDTTLDRVMFEISQQFPDFDAYVCLAPTSPLRNGLHINEAVTQFMHSKADSLVSAVPEFKSIWTLDHTFASPLVLRTQNRQEVYPVYVGNGAIFITKREILTRFRQRTGGRVAIYPMSHEDSVDVHTQEDIELAEYYISRQTKDFNWEATDPPEDFDD